LKHYGCVSTGYSNLDNLVTELENHFKKCNWTIEIYEQTNKDCHEKCKPNCIQNNFNIFFTYTRSNLVNTSRYFIFLSEKSSVKYIYTPKTDIYRLVYELGGVLGLWFGFSAYSICVSSSLTFLNALYLLNIRIKWINKLFSSCKKLSTPGKTKGKIPRRKHILDFSTSRFNKF